MEKEYQVRIDEMNTRVQERICLFEEAQLNAAKSQADKQVRSILSEAGLQIQDIQ